MIVNFLDFLLYRSPIMIFFSYQKCETESWSISKANRGSANTQSFVIIMDHSAHDSRDSQRKPEQNEFTERFYCTQPIHAN